MKSNVVSFMRLTAYNERFRKSKDSLKDCCKYTTKLLTLTLPVSGLSFMSVKIYTCSVLL